MKKLLSAVLLLSMLLSIAGIPNTALAAVGDGVSTTVDMDESGGIWKVVYIEDATKENLIGNELKTIWGGATAAWEAFTDGKIKVYNYNDNKSLTAIVNPRGGTGIQKLTSDAPYYGNYLTFMGKALVNYAITFDMQLASCDKRASRNEYIAINFKDATKKNEYTSNTNFEALFTLPRAQVAGVLNEMKDDNGNSFLVEASLINADSTEGEGRVFATDSKTGNKYLVSETVDGVTTYYNRKLNFKIVVDGGIETIWWKWEDSQTWKKNSSRELLKDTPTYVGIHSYQCQPVITDFKVYQRENEIVKEPEVITLDSFVAEESDEMIASPHFGTPAFTEPGASFTAEVRSKNTTLGKDGWKVYLENEYKTWWCSVTADEYAENAIYMGTKAGYKLNVTVPTDISPELMNLVIMHEDDETLKFVSPQAVSVVPEVDADFYAVGISDTHLTGWKKENSTVSEGRNIETMNKALEIAGARYLYHGGDIGGNGVDKIKVMKNYFVDAFTTSKMPLIAVAGNHEYDKYSYPSGTLIKDESLTEIDWSEVTAETDLTDKQVVSNFTFDAFDRMFGKRSALIGMGDNLVIAKHDFGAYRTYTGDGTEQELSEPIALRNALANEWKNWNNGQDGLRVLYQHTWNTGGETSDSDNSQNYVYGTAAFMSPTYHNDTTLPAYDFQAVGHNHATYAVNDNLLQFGGTGHDDCNWSGESIIFNYTYDENSSKKWALNTNELLKNDKYKDTEFMQYTTNTIAQMTDEEKAERLNYIDTYYQDDFVIDGALEEPALYSTYYNKNNGTAEFNVETITNTLDFNFYDGRVKFVMKKGSYVLDDNAQLLSQYDSVDGLYTIVTGKVNIPAATDGKNAVISVSCSKTDETETATYNLEGTETGFVAADTSALNLVRISGAEEALTKENVTVTNNGTDVNYTVEKINGRTYSIVFTDGLNENSRYTVTVGEQSFIFNVLPKDCIKDDYYGDEGIITASGHSIAFPNNPLKNFVMEFTLRHSTPGRSERTPEAGYNYGRLNLHFYTTVDGTKYDYFFYHPMMYSATEYPNWHLYAATTPSGKGIGDGLIKKRGNADTGSILEHNPVTALENEENYNFRVIRLGKELSVWVKKTTDSSYDRIFEYFDTGAAEGKEYFYLPEEAGYVHAQLAVGGASNNAVKGLRLYEIDNSAIYPEKQGTYFNLEYGVQPETEITSLTATTADGEVTLPVTRTGAKCYKVDLSALNWKPESVDMKINLPGYTSVFGQAVAAQELSLSPISEMATIADESYTESDGKINVTATVTSNFKNSTGTMNAKAICVTYSDGRLTDVDVKDIAGGENKVVFDAVTAGDECVIFVFETLTNIVPLTKCKHVVDNN